MASIDSFLGSSLQNLNTLDKKIANDGSDENMKKVVEYLYTLTEQLRYMFNNLDTENFTDGVFHRTIRDETTQQYTQIVQTNDALTAIVAGLNAAQKAAKLTFDAEGLSIQNGGFKILDDNNNTTMSVSNSGDINIVGSYKTDAYSDSSNNSQWSEWDEAMLNFYYKPTGGSTEIIAKMGQAKNSQGTMLEEGVIATQKGTIYIAEDLNVPVSSLQKYVDIGVQSPSSNTYGYIWLSDSVNNSLVNINANQSGSIYLKNSNGDFSLTIDGGSGTFGVHGSNSYAAKLSKDTYGGVLYLWDLSGNSRVTTECVSTGTQITMKTANNKTGVMLDCYNSLRGLYVYDSAGSSQPIRAIVNSSNVGNMYADNYNNNSSRRYKKDITDMSDEQAQKLLDLKFVKFKYKGRDTYNYGLIAEDTPLDEVVVCDAEGRPDAIDYTKLIPYMGKLIQEQDKRIKALEMKQ